MPPSALLAVARRATPGEWTTGPSTAAGFVWVYSRGSPLAEPASPRDWLTPVRALGFKLFRARVLYDLNPPLGNVGDPHWSIQERNAAHIAAFNPAVCIALLERLREAEEIMAQVARDRIVLENSDLEEAIDAWLARAQKEET